MTFLDLVSPVFQAQLVVLSAQIAWSENVETALSSMGGSGDAAPLHSVLSNVEVTLNVLADSVLMAQPPLRRRKLEHLVSAVPVGWIMLGKGSHCPGRRADGRRMGPGVGMGSGCPLQRVWVGCRGCIHDSVVGKRGFRTFSSSPSTWAQRPCRQARRAQHGSKPGSLSLGFAPQGEAERLLGQRWLYPPHQSFSWLQSFSLVRCF